MSDERRERIATIVDEYHITTSHEDLDDLIDFADERMDFALSYADRILDLLDEGEREREVEIIGRVSEEDAKKLTPMDQMMVRIVPEGVEVWGTSVGMNVRNERPVDLVLIRRQPEEESE